MRRKQGTSDIVNLNKFEKGLEEGASGENVLFNVPIAYSLLPACFHKCIFVNYGLC